MFEYVKLNPKKGATSYSDGVNSITTGKIVKARVTAKLNSALFAGGLVKCTEEEYNTQEGIKVADTTKVEPKKVETAKTEDTNKTK
jgi:hypothetical protein